MASMRAQLSLQFYDEELYTNFIKPYKEQRHLNSLIIKCLSAYYYDDEVRSRIDGVSIDAMSDEPEVSSTQEICDSIRQALAMQDFMAQELKNTMETGTEDISNMLNKTNEMAEQTGVAKTTETKSGSTMLRISTSVEETVKNVEDNNNDMTIDSKLNIVIKAVELLAKASGNVEVSNLFTNVSNGSITKEVKTEEVIKPVVEEISYDVEEDISAEEDISSDTIELAPPPVLSSTIQSQAEEIKEEVVVPPEVSDDTDKSNTNDKEDATDSVRELLDSLL